MSSSDPSDGKESKPRKGVNEKNEFFLKKIYKIFTLFNNSLYLY
jgi:hypothetical protein